MSENKMEGQALYTVTCSCFLMLLAAAFGANQMTEGQSCGDKEVFLTSNKTLAPLNMISVSGVASYPATDLYNFGYDRDSYFDTWCTTDSNSQTPFAEMELTSPVLITQILTSGRSTPTDSYFVTKFTLEYSLPNEPTNLSYYLTETGNIQYFITSQLNTLIRLERPLLTKRLRVRPVTWFDSVPKSFEYICLGIGLYGCLATEGMPIVTDPEDPQTSAPPTTFSVSGNGGTAAESMTVVIRDNQTVAIVLPIALLTIIINAAIVGAGVFLCMYLNRQNKKENKIEHPHSYVNLEMSSNSLGQSQKSLEDHPVDSERLNMPRPSIGVIKKVDNPIYGSSFAPAESDIDATIDEHIYTSASETDYEPVDPVVHSKTNDDDELLYNLAYGTGEVDTQAESTEQTFDGNDLELKDNACYGSVSSTPIPDEGEYSFPSDYEPVQLNDDSLS